MNALLRKAARNAYQHSLSLQKGESVLVIYDKSKEEIANAFFAETTSFLARAEKVEIPLGDHDGQEPPDAVAERMKHFDVIVAATTTSLTHTAARKQASAKGARIATLPGITVSIMERLFDVDYQYLKNQVSPLYDLLKKAKEIIIKTEKGTSITLNVAKQPWEGLNSGIARKGEVCNLPDGELYCAPHQEGTSGIIVFDGSFAGIGRLAAPIRIRVKDGYATSVTGGEEAKKLAAGLKAVNDPNAYNIAELGIGTNGLARITGNILEDEKVKGTIHIALGNNTGFGGSIDVPIHVDGVVLQPTVFADNQKILHRGVWAR